MPRLSKREKILLLILCITILGYCYYTYLLTPQLINLDTLKQNVEKNELILNQLLVSKGSIEKMKKDVEDLNNKALESENGIPDDSRIPEIIMDIKNMSETSGCTGERLSFNPPMASQPKQGTENDKAKNDPGIMTIPIAYQVRGSYESIMLLIKSIENNQRIMAVDNITLNKDPQTGMLVANLNISCYYLNKVTQQRNNYSFLNIPSGKQDIFN